MLLAISCSTNQLSIDYEAVKPVWHTNTNMQTPLSSHSLSVSPPHPSGFRPASSKVIIIINQQNKRKRKRKKRIEKKSSFSDTSSPAPLARLPASQSRLERPPRHLRPRRGRCRRDFAVPAAYWQGHRHDRRQGPRSSGGRLPARLGYRVGQRQRGRRGACRYPVLALAACLRQGNRDLRHGRRDGARLPWLGRYRVRYRQRLRHAWAAWFCR